MFLKRGILLVASLGAGTALAAKHETQVQCPPGTVPSTTVGTGGSGYMEEEAVPVETKTRKEQRRFWLDLGGGAEGYTGGYANRVAPGPAWSVFLGGNPLPFMGLQVGYTGAANNVTDAVAPGRGLAKGADVLRNGGEVDALLNLPTPIIQPYVLGGVGYDHYTIRKFEQAGFVNDSAGRVPVGGGIRGNVGPFQANIRATYDILFSDAFSDPGGVRTTGNAYTALAQLGGRF